MSRWRDTKGRVPASGGRSCCLSPTVVALEPAEGPLFVSYPIGIDAAELREGMRLQLRWTDGANRFGEYNLPVFGPPPS